MMLETVDSLWKSANNDRYKKLNDFTLKTHSMFRNVCVLKYVLYAKASQI